MSNKIPKLVRLAKKIGHLKALEKLLNKPVEAKPRQPKKPKHGLGLTRRKCKILLYKLKSGKLKNLKQGAKEAEVSYIYFTDALRYYFPASFKKILQKEGIKQLICPGCKREFCPPTDKSTTCSGRCTQRVKRDEEYFSGNRLSAVGLTEGVCQICWYPKKNLAAHHVLGKKYDPEDKYLIALCNGCHELLTKLALRTFVTDSRRVEELLNWTLIRMGFRDRVAKVSYIVDDNNV